MTTWEKNFLKELQETRTTYKDMIDFCCDAIILNNSILPELSNKGFYFDVFCGSDYDEETDSYSEIFQYFVIDSQDAERLAEYTNELVMYNEDLDLYLLCVCHFGTCWDGVPANWKDNIEE